MSNSISNFIGAFKGGSRANRFTVGGKILNGATYHVRATSFPASTLGVIPINWRGRTVNYPGERAYAPWQITILDDPKMATKLFEAFHTWSNLINNHTTNANSGAYPEFDSSLTVSQLGTDSDAAVRTCKLQNAFPQSVGELAYDMSQDNALLSFAVTIGYSHYLTI